MRWSNLLIALLLSLSACSVYKAEVDPAPPIEMAKQFSASSPDGEAVEQWWLKFGDEGLNATIAAVIDNNLDMQEAWSRLKQVETLSKQAASSWWPQIELEAGSSRTRANSPVTDPLTGYITDYTAQHTNEHYVSIAAAYEIDFWGKIDSQDKAAQLDLKVSHLSVETLALSMAAQAAELWFQLAEQQSQLDLARKQLGVNETYLELQELRFGRGLADSAEVYQQRSQVAALSAQLPLLESAVRLSRHQLNVLLGRSPNTELKYRPAGLPQLWAQPSVGIPSDLLLRRPDVLASQLQVMAADNRVGVAVADRFPSFTISAATGYDVADYSDLLENWVWSIADSIVVSVFDGHRKNQEVKRQKALVEEALNSYGNVLLTSVKEVEDALVKEDAQQDYLDKLKSQEELAEATLNEARLSYLNGLSDYLTVLTALQSLQQTQRDILTAQHELISYRIQLCRALGGTWTRELKNNKELAGVEQ